MRVTSDAEVAQDRGELAAGVGPADDRDRHRQLGQAADVVVGHGQLGTGDGQPPGVPADRDDDGVTGERCGRPVTRTVCGSTNKAGPACWMRSMPRLRIESASRFCSLCVVGKPSGVFQRCDDVELRSVATQAKLPPRACVSTIVRAARAKRADWTRAAVQARTAQPLCLDQSDFGPKFPSLERSGGASRSAADYENPHDQPDSSPIRPAAASPQAGDSFRATSLPRSEQITHRRRRSLSGVLSIPGELGGLEVIGVRWSACASASGCFVFRRLTVRPIGARRPARQTRRGATETGPTLPTLRSAATGLPTSTGIAIVGRS